MQDPVREVRVIIDAGKELRIVTNDLDSPVQEIADLYKQRWDIELFFRWIKQVRKIKHFIGISENAVRIQIAVALIAFLILRLATAAAKGRAQPPPICPALSTNLMHQRRLDRLLEHRATAQKSPNQFSFALYSK